MNEEYPRPGVPGPGTNTPPPPPPVPTAPPRPGSAPVYMPGGYGQPVRGYTPPYPYAPPNPAKKTNGQAIASMVTGIVSILFFYALFFSAAAGALAVIFGICSRRGDDKLSGPAVAGIVCGTVGLILGILMIISLGSGSFILSNNAAANALFSLFS